jgi:RecB family endonuclease NucS
MYTNTFRSVKEQEPTHVKGITLCEQFYINNVSPILSTFPQFEQNHCACLIGFGSEVLGYDTRMSEDHDYGPRLIIILPDEYYAEHSQAMHNKLANELPRTFFTTVSSSTQYNHTFHIIGDHATTFHNLVLENGSVFLNKDC